MNSQMLLGLLRLLGLLEPDDQDDEKKKKKNENLFLDLLKFYD